MRYITSRDFLYSRNVLQILNENTFSNISNIMTNVTLRPSFMISKTCSLSLLCQQPKICFDYRKMAKDVSNFNDILLHKEREIPCRKEVNVECIIVMLQTVTHKCIWARRYQSGVHLVVKLSRFKRLILFKPATFAFQVNFTENNLLNPKVID